MTLELLPIMLDTASSTGDGRIVFMSSEAHKYARWDPDKMNAEEEQYYDRIKVYGVTKLYNVSSRFYFRSWASGNVILPDYLPFPQSSSSPEPNSRISPPLV